LAPQEHPNLNHLAQKLLLKKGKLYKRGTKPNPSKERQNKKQKYKARDIQGKEFRSPKPSLKKSSLIKKRVKSSTI